MSEEGDEEGGNCSLSLPGIPDDAQVCKELDREELTARVRKMTEDLEATRIPRHDVPVALVVESITREKIAASWSRLCHDGGRPSDGRHVGHVVRSTVSPTSPGGAMALGAVKHSCVMGDKEGEEEQRQQQQHHHHHHHRRALTWEDEYPRSRYRGDFFKPPLFDDEPSDSDDDESKEPCPSGADGKFH